MNTEFEKYEKVHVNKTALYEADNPESKILYMLKEGDYYIENPFCFHGRIKINMNIEMIKNKDKFGWVGSSDVLKIKGEN